MRNNFFILLIIFVMISCSNSKQKSISNEQLQKAREEAIANLDSSKFEILEEEILPKITNYYILYKGVINKDSITNFVLRFRNVHCRPGNIYLYDTKKVYPLCKKYPLERNEYIQIADHFIGESSFESSNDVMMYPFQDVLYKKYGGRNWRKKN